MGGARLGRDLSLYTLCAFCMWNHANIALRTQAPVHLGEHMGPSPTCASRVPTWESTPHWGDQEAHVLQKDKSCFGARLWSVGRGGPR